MDRHMRCEDCEASASSPVTRRDFVKVVSASAAAIAAAGPIGMSPRQMLGGETAGSKPKAAPETLVKQLHDSLSPEQRKDVCFDWDYKDDRGLLRTHVSNNWNVTDPQTLNVGGKFYTSDQQDLIREIFLGLYNPDWHDRILKQLKDDAGGYGKSQTIALFGTPGSGKFEFLMTGRHLTIRCDGDSTENVAMGGPVFYGHAADGFNEKAGHPGNVFWYQAQKANALFKMLDGKQREQALVAVAPPEAKVEFKGKSSIPGVHIGELSPDQKAHAQEVLKALVEPYRTSDQQEVMKALNAQGGLDECRLAFYRSNSKGESLDLGDDGEWDVWRLEGPAFVWHFRGVPHVHVWVNVADDPSVQLNAKG